MTLTAFGLVLLAGGGMYILVRIRRMLLRANERIHRLERDQRNVQAQLASVCRRAAIAEARGAIGSDVQVQCHSQHGEEFYLWERLGFKRDGTFIEIGAYNGVSLSNSFFFEKLGWRGVLVEAHPGLVEECRKARPAASVVHAALCETDGGSVTFSMVRGENGVDTLSFLDTTDRHRRRIEHERGRIEKVEVPARSLGELVKELQLSDVDWISVDVEGAELSVLRGAGLEWFHPRLILAEDNSAGANRDVADYLARFGYRRVQTIGCNDLYEYSPAT